MTADGADLLGKCSSHSGGGYGLDFARYCALAGCSIGILVLAEIFLRERVDVRARPLFGAAPDPPADLDITIGIVPDSDDLRARPRRRAFFQVARPSPGRSRYLPERCRPCSRTRPG